MESVFIRVISNEQRKDELLERLKTFCIENGLEFRITQDEPYWKIETHFEMSIDLYPSPVWNYGKWCEAYKFLFKQDFTIEWEENEDISLCYYPDFDDLNSYFVIFHIPSKKFFPKPSKTIRH